MTQTATIGQVKDDFETILNWIANGDEVTVLRDENPVAQITPAKPKQPPLPDYAARRKLIGGNSANAADDWAKMRDYFAGAISEEELLGKSKPEKLPPLPDYAARRKRLGGHVLTAKECQELRDLEDGVISVEDFLA